MFSILILTFNEERRLPACLASASGCDDIVVLDSGSTDRTVPIAREAGARVLARGFTDFASQRNHPHELGVFRHPWVFHLDADEALTPEIREECAAVCRRDPADVDGYHAAPRMRFEGAWIRHCTDYPAWQARFVHAARFRFIQAGHGQREAPGMRMGRLRGDYWHDIWIPEQEWEPKHRRYAREEAAAMLEGFPGAGVLLRRIVRGPALERRRALKALSLVLPARPALRLLYQFVLRGGFLDGRPGWHYCLRMARYEGFIAGELRRLRGGGAP